MSPAETRPPPNHESHICRTPRRHSCRYPRQTAASRCAADSHARQASGPRPRTGACTAGAARSTRPRPSLRLWWQRYRLQKMPCSDGRLGPGHGRPGVRAAKLPWLLGLPLCRFPPLAPTARTFPVPAPDLRATRFGSPCRGSALGNQARAADRLAGGGDGGRRGGRAQPQGCGPGQADSTVRGSHSSDLAQVVGSPRRG